MDRRTLLKSSGLLLSGLAVSRLLSTAHAAPITAQPIPLSAEHPLLLNFNENALGMSPKALEAVVKALPGANRYPDASREALIEQLTAYHKVPVQQITLGNGSSETIQATVQAIVNRFQQQGKEVQLIAPDPTFNYAELYAQPLGVTISKVPLTADMAFDLAAMKQKATSFNGASIVYLCNPNNPTATITPADEINAWVKVAPTDTMFIMDEAYAEFVSDSRFRSALELVKAGSKNVVVTRTFSKIYALAGLRVGYGIAHADVIAEIEPFVSIDNTNTAGAAAALASLSDSQFLDASLRSNDLSRKIVTQALDELKLEYLPSQANFVFHKVPGNVKTYQERMKQYHIFVGREFPPAIGWSRLTLGTPDEMLSFVVVLKMFREKGWI